MEAISPKPGLANSILSAPSWKRFYRSHPISYVSYLPRPLAVRGRGPGGCERQRKEGKKKERKEGRKSDKERERKREGGKRGRWKGEGKEGERKGGREGRKEGGKEGGKERSLLSIQIP